MSQVLILYPVVLLFQALHLLHCASAGSAQMNHLKYSHVVQPMSSLFTFQKPLHHSSSDCPLSVFLPPAAFAGGSVVTTHLLLPWSSSTPASTIIIIRLLIFKSCSPFLLSVLTHLTSWITPFYSRFLPRHPHHCHPVLVHGGNCWVLVNNEGDSLDLLYLKSTQR